MKTTLFVSALSGLFFLAACTGGSTEPLPGNNGQTPPTTNPPTGSGGDKTGTKREALNFTSPCTAGACGEVPASSTSSKPTCAPSEGGSCGWSDPDPNGTVSYAPCEESKCGTKPDQSVCPAGTTFKGAQCGSENDQACKWQSACVPPKSTTPCPDANGCGDGKPEIGVICKDGSTGDLACMKLASGKCGWEPTCE